MKSRLGILFMAVALALACTSAALFLNERRQRIQAQLRIEELLGTLAKRDALRPLPTATPAVRERGKFWHYPNGSVEYLSHGPHRSGGALDAPGPGYRAQREKAEINR